MTYMGEEGEEMPIENSKDLLDAFQYAYITSNSRVLRIRLNTKQREHFEELEEVK